MINIYLKEKKGFTLIELIIVITLSSLFLLPLMFYLRNTVEHSGYSYIMGTASFLAQGKLEETVRQGVLPSASSGSFNSPYDDYSYSVSWDYVDSTNLDLVVAPGPTECKLITVSVSNPSISTINLSRLVCDYYDEET